MAKYRRAYSVYICARTRPPDIHSMCRPICHTCVGHAASEWVCAVRGDNNSFARARACDTHTRSKAVIKKPNDDAHSGCDKGARRKTACMCVDTIKRQRARFRIFLSV